MLIIEKNCVYEIDEECLKRRKVPMECGTMQKVKEMKERERAAQQNSRKRR